MRNSAFAWKLSALFGLLMAGCDMTDSRNSAPVPTARAVPVEVMPDASSSDKRGGPTQKVIGGVRFEIPADWDQKQQVSDVLLAEFSVPGEAGTGRLTLSSAGGGTAANLERWKGQFQRGSSDPEAKESLITVAGKQSSFIELHGTYSDMFGGGVPKSQWQLLGVAIPIDGQNNYFVKFTGPAATVTARREEFLNFVQSAQFHN